MNIFLLGPFANFDGYGHLSRQHALLLKEMGHDVVARCFHEPQKVPKWGEGITDLCSKKDLDDYDMAIVYKPPVNQHGEIEQVHLSKPIDKIKRKVWFTMFETSEWPPSWEAPLSHFDEIWTMTQWQAAAAKTMFRDKKVVKIPYFFEPVVRIPVPPSDYFLEEDYLFYSEFSSLTHRKGLDILLTAYMDAFDQNDSVRLQIKIPDHCEKDFRDYFLQAANCFQYKEIPKVELCSAFITDTQMDKLMMDCHTYVCVSRGEGFCIPLAKAALNAIPTLYPGEKNQFAYKLGWGLDYCHPNGEYNANPSRVFTDEFYRHGLILDTSKMKWLEPDVGELSTAMKRNFTDKVIFDGRNQITSEKILSKSSVIAKLEAALLSG